MSQNSGLVMTSFLGVSSIIHSSLLIPHCFTLASAIFKLLVNYYNWVIHFKYIAFGSQWHCHSVTLLFWWRLLTYTSIHTILHTYIYIPTWQHCGGCVNVEGINLKRDEWFRALFRIGERSDSCAPDANWRQPLSSSFFSLWQSTLFKLCLYSQFQS